MDTTTAKLEPSGRILIPAEWRKKMNLKPGTDVILRLDDSGIHVIGTQLQALRRIQAKLSALAPERMLSEELIVERTKEAIEDEQLSS